MYKLYSEFIFLGLLLWSNAAFSEITSNTSLSGTVTQIPAVTRCDLSRLEYSIATLEVLMNKKFDSWTTDLIDANKHLASLEYQATVEQNGVAEVRNEIRKLASSIQSSRGQSPQTSGTLERKVEDIAQGTHLSTAALTLLTQDVYALNQNVSELVRVIKNRKPDLLERAPLVEQIQCLQNEQPKNCKEIKKNHPQSQSGIYSIKPNADHKDFMTFCDMETNGGGWLVIQNRYDGSQDFYLDFDQYKVGFGNIAAEYWLGLENIYSLTGQKVHELLVELTDANNIKVSAYYSAFSIGAEEEGYPLRVLGGYQGDAGDSLSYHAGQKFSAKDKDQDSWVEGSCAQSHGGAWWYKTCDKTNLNGAYYTAGQLPDELIYKGIYWNDFQGPQYSLMKSRILIRPRDGSSTAIN